MLKVKIVVVIVIGNSVYLIFISLGDRLQNGSPYAIGPLSVLSCLSVTLVCCGQTVGWIKMKLGMMAGLGPGHTVSATPKKGAYIPIFGPCLLSPNDWMDDDATWYGGRPRLRRHCVRWGPAPPKMGTAP